MTSEEVDNFCKSWLAAWSGNQPDKLIDFYSEDAFYSDPARREGLRGRAKIYPYFCKLLSKYPDWQWEMVEVFANESGFTLKWKAFFSPEESLQPVYGLDIVMMSNSKIIRNEVYFDTRSVNS